MKKTILSIGAAAMFAFAISSCKQGNVEEMMKQDAEKSSSMMQTKIDELNAKLDEECNAKIEETAQTQFQAYADSIAKVQGAKKVVVKKKPVVKPAPVKVTPTTTNGGKKDATTGTNVGKKDATTTPQGVNLGKKK